METSSKPSIRSTESTCSVVTKQRVMRVQTIDVLETNIPLMFDIWEMGMQVVVEIQVVERATHV